MEEDLSHADTEMFMLYFKRGGTVALLPVSRCWREKCLHTNKEKIVIDVISDIGGTLKLVMSAWSRYQ